MKPTWPKEVLDFESYLENDGLVCRRRREEATFGDKLLEYANADIKLRILSDRGIWFIEVGDVSAHTDEWYDAALFHDLLNGQGKDVLSLSEQIAVIKADWARIISSFRPTERENTHARLALLRKERAKRRFPSLNAEGGNF